MTSVFAHDLILEDGEPIEPMVKESLNGFVTIAIGDSYVSLLADDWLNLIKFAAKRSNSAVASEDDPLRFLHRGEDDPIGDFDPENVCGVPSDGDEDWGPGVFECVREPHPADWVHVDCSDGVVDAVWMNV